MVAAQGVEVIDPDGLKSYAKLALPSGIAAHPTGDHHVVVPAPLAAEEDRT